MSDMFKGKSEVDDIIEQVNKLKREKEELKRLDGEIASAGRGESRSAKLVSVTAVNVEPEKPQESKTPEVKTSAPKAVPSKVNAAARAADEPPKAVKKSPPQEFKLDDKVSKKADKEFKPKKKKRHAALFVVGLIVILVIGAYITGYIYVKDKFLPNTYINGVNVSGMSLDEATAAVEDNASEYALVFTKRDGSTLTLPYSRFGYTFNTEEVVKKELDDENYYLYFTNLFKTTTADVTLDGSYDDAALKEQTDALAFGTEEPENAKIVKGDDGKFTIEEEKEGTAVDYDKVYEAAKAAISSGELEIDVAAAGLYKEPTVTAEDLEEKLEEVNKIFSVTVELNFDYTTEKVSYDTIPDAFDVSEDGSYTIDQEVVWSWVETLRSKYDTLHKTRKFTSTLQGEIEINSQDDYYGKKDAIFGYLLDSDQTAAAIVEAFKSGESQTIEPIYYSTGGYTYDTMDQVQHDASDEGDVITDISRISSYIEVDLTNQTLWYYKDGEKLYECGVVSGLPTAERMTYPGIYQLWMKERDKVMEGSTSDGSTYTTPCTFWNYISVRSIGIHDATWQSSFGGTRYTWAGSHGCVGVSYDSAQYIFDNVPIGTVVIMYY